MMVKDWAVKGRLNKVFGWQIDAIYALRGSVLTINYLYSLAIGWFIYSCILGLVLAVLG